MSNDSFDINEHFKVLEEYNKKIGEISYAYECIDSKVDNFIYNFNRIRGTLLKLEIIDKNISEKILQFSRDKNKRKNTTRKNNRMYIYICNVYIAVCREMYNKISGQDIGRYNPLNFYECYKLISDINTFIIKYIYEKQFNEEVKEEMINIFSTNYTLNFKGEEDISKTKKVISEVATDITNKTISLNLI